MISPSRRRRAQLPEVGAYTLHVVTARRMALDRRVWRAAVGALGGALVGAVLSRIFEFPVLAHLGSTLVAAAIGAALPVRPLGREALDSIADQVGLAYESGLTVLEREGAGGAPDEFGLAARVLEAGARSVRDYRRPQAPAWWLPAAVLALATLGLTYAFPRRVATAAPARTTEAVLTAEQEAGEDRPLERVGELDGRPEAASRAEGAAAQDQVGGVVDDRDALPPGTEVGNEALSRFLEALRQGESAPNSGAGSGAASSVGGGESADGGEPGQTGEPGTAAAEAPPPGGGDGGGGDSSGDPSDAGDSGGTEAAGAPPERTNGEASDEGAARPPAGAAQRATEGRATEDERGLSEGEEAAGGGGAQRPGDDDRGGGAEGGASGGDEGSSEAGAVGVGGASLEDAAEGGETAFLTGGVELLPGVMGAGPTNPAGRVRLPGASDVELPAGTPLGPYAEAAEEAVGEGDLPAGYQEIIRRYFR